MIVHFFLVCLITILLAFFISQLNVTNQYDTELLSAYECGFNPFSDTRSAFDVKFYLVAIFFIIFDLEIIFFFPFVVYVTKLSIFQFSIVIVFIFQLFLGLCYEYLSGTLEWSQLLHHFLLRCFQLYLFQLFHLILLILNFQNFQICFFLIYLLVVFFIQPTFAICTLLIIFQILSDFQFF